MNNMLILFIIFVIILFVSIFHQTRELFDNTVDDEVDDEITSFVTVPDTPTPTTVITKTISNITNDGDTITLTFDGDDSDTIVINAQDKYSSYYTQTNMIYKCYLKPH